MAVAAGVVRQNSDGGRLKRLGRFRRKSQASRPPSSGAPLNKSTQCHHMTDSNVTDWEKSLLEAINA